MKKIVTAIFCLITVVAQSQKVWVNDANAVQRNLTGDFSSIKISGGIDLYLSQYEEVALAVSAADADVRDNIRTDIENGTLRIYYDSKAGWIRGNKKMKVYLAFKSIDKLIAGGACDVQVAGTISVPKLLLDLSGASEFKGAVAVTDLQVESSGASDVKINGYASNANIHCSGASDLKGYDLVVDNCNIKASGASDINITVNKELNVNASGASDVHYKGTAVIKDIKSSGASTVVARKS